MPLLAGPAVCDLGSTGGWWSSAASPQLNGPSRRIAFHVKRCYGKNPLSTGLQRMLLASLPGGAFAFRCRGLLRRFAGAGNVVAAERSSQMIPVVYHLSSTS